MSADTKFVVRPKVRFSQNDSEELIKKNIEKTTISKGKNNSSQKPKVKSVVTLKNPIRIVKRNEIPGRQVLKESKVINNTENTKSLSLNSSMHSAKTSCLRAQSTKAKNQPTLHDTRNTQNIKVNSKEVNIQKTLANCSNDNAVICATSLQESQDLNEIIQAKDCTKSQPPRNKCIEIKKGKENETATTKKQIKAMAMKNTDIGISKSEGRLCSSGTNIKSGMRNKPHHLGSTKRNLNSKPIAIGVMPCHKHNKNVPKVKSSLVKKTIVRDIVGPKVKACIEPGVIRKKLDAPDLPADQNTHTKSIISGDKLARPEYNSIMCTINKLNEMKKQKVVIDMEHLPAAYKNVVNGKISTALDFPLDEAIYKNLVDLSIDENQLPCRLIRSKDPEPRQRDVIPVLSDFFTPVSTEEYCTTVSIKPRTSEDINSWSAFRISDQICKWKYVLDHI